MVTDDIIITVILMETLLSSDVSLQSREVRNSVQLGVCSIRVVE